MKEKQVIMFTVATKTITLESFHTLSEENKFHSIDMIFTTYYFFRV